jgi:hypothetical protein
LQSPGGLIALTEVGRVFPELGWIVQRPVPVKNHADAVPAPRHRIADVTKWGCVCLRGARVRVCASRPECCLAHDRRCGHRTGNSPGARLRPDADPGGRASRCGLHRCRRPRPLPQLAPARLLVLGDQPSTRSGGRGLSRNMTDSGPASTHHAVGWSGGSNGKEKLPLVAFVHTHTHTFTVKKARWAIRSSFLIVAKRENVALKTIDSE